MLPDAIPEARDVGQIGLDYSTQQENGSATVSLKIPLFQWVSEDHAEFVGRTAFHEAGGQM